MSHHLRYLSYVLRHKWFVFVAGVRTGAPLWRLLVHDLSKFRPSEWVPYARYFYGTEPTADALRDRYGGRPNDAANAAAWKAEQRAAFDRAWLHHQKRNPHHWQYWVLMEDAPSGMRFRLQSPDNVVTYLTEGDIGYHEGVYLSGADLTDPDGDRRYRIAHNAVAAANRYRALPMPEAYVREMVADWMGAGRAITGRWEVGEWYAKNAANMVLHDVTRARVAELIARVSGPAAAAVPALP